MPRPKMPHSGHNQHICYLVNLGFQNRRSQEYKKLVREAKFLCKSCGRVAAKAKNLCFPAKL
jgi:hypothetical protein